MIMMSSLILLCLYYDCSNNLLECDTKDFPGISHTMAIPPFNKLYAIMLTFYSCTYQATARAYHHRLTGIASSTTNTLLLAFCVLACIFGPAIGFFDVVYDSHHHGMVTKVFVIGEVGYCFLITSILNGSRDQFPGASSLIDKLVFCRNMTIFVGLLQQVPDLGIVGTLCEWVAFYTAFYMHYILSLVMGYVSIVVPQKKLN